MRLAAALAALMLSACTYEAPPPAAASAAWRPAPIQGAREPSEVIAASTAADWRPVDPENLLIVDLADGGRVAIELAPDFAPVHVANIRAFARGGWWNGTTVYRVQDNYVAQWGNGEADTPLPQGVVRTPPAEYDRALAGLEVRPLGFPDSYAPVAGHSGGWPIGYDPDSGRAWLTHCYASVGVGRDTAPDTGTGGELYAVIGHSPRHLDLNIANVGRVIDGISVLSARPRGTGNLGFYDTERGEQPIPIARARIAADIPAAERPAYEAMRTDTPAFAAYVTGRANRGGSFFIRAAGGIDVCNAAVPVRRQAGQ
ncbi:peptidylprolyl isomerase [Allosphingosinicella sp.]|jgi:peptidylprolyl isomerase|uniref:peptidylprolyl isomerase n=1 Tax=Allosphingosinicella sp. TaxID=2823234 RepID=UPI002F028D36